MRNRSRLDLLCVPTGLDTVLAHERWEDLKTGWIAAGLLDPAGAPTARLVDGGGAGLRIDLPTTRVVYANQLGGFRVRCPSCGAGLASEFAHAIERAREEGPVRVSCRACHSPHPLEALVTRPPIRVGRSALILQDVGGSRLTEPGASAIRDWIGDFSVVLRRVS